MVDDSAFRALLVSARANKGVSASGTLNALWSGRCLRARSDRGAFRGALVGKRERRDSRSRDPASLEPSGSEPGNGLPLTFSQGGDLGGCVRADSSRTSEGNPVFGLAEAHGRTQT